MAAQRPARQLPDGFEARTGGMVMFDTPAGPLRGQLLWFALYLPPASGKPLMTKFHGQTVLFGYVHSSAPQANLLVVRVRHTLHPFAVATLTHRTTHLYITPAAQTLFLSKNKPVEGVPYANVLDAARFEAYRALTIENLTDDRGVEARRCSVAAAPGRFTERRCSTGA